MELNRRAAELAREAVGDDVLVAGSIGPTGHLTDPLGPLTRELAVATFAEQARALAEGGVDLLVIETFFSLDEGLWAVEAVQSVSDLPLVVSYSFDQGTRTMMGLRPRRSSRRLRRSASRRRRELRQVARRHRPDRRRAARRRRRSPALGEAERRRAADRRRHGGLRRRPRDACRAPGVVRRERGAHRRRLLRVDACPYRRGRACDQHRLSGAAPRDAEPARTTCRHLTRHR